MMHAIDILIMSLVCNGAYILFKKGNLLYFIAKPIKEIIEDIEEEHEKELMKAEQECENLDDRLRLKSIAEKKLKDKLWFEHLFKPLFLCVGCMASVWGGATYIALNGIESIDYLMMLVCCVCAIPLNFFIYKQIEDYV